VAGALLAALLVSAAPSGRAAALPASYVVDTVPRPAGGVAIVGDSLTVSFLSGLPNVLRFAGFGPFQIEARSARRTVVSIKGSTSGIDGVRHIRASGFDPPLWVIALGTNDANLTARSPGATDMTIVAMLNEIGPGHRVVWVNTFAARSTANARAFNDRLQAIAATRSNLTVADWYSFAAAHRSWIREDGVHPTMTGAVQRNAFVVQQAVLARTASSLHR
jgi:lysophospholipase L1-like esterase